MLLRPISPPGSRVFAATPTPEPRAAIPAAAAAAAAEEPAPPASPPVVREGFVVGDPAAEGIEGAAHATATSWLLAAAMSRFQRIVAIVNKG